VEAKLPSPYLAESVSVLFNVIGRLKNLLQDAAESLPLNVSGQCIDLPYCCWAQYTCSILAWQEYAAKVVGDDVWFSTRNLEVPMAAKSSQMPSGPVIVVEYCSCNHKALVHTFLFKLQVWLVKLRTVFSWEQIYSSQAIMQWKVTPKRLCKEYCTCSSDICQSVSFQPPGLVGFQT